MLLIIDNYDSFVFNIARYCEELGQPTRVVRNDAVSPADVAALDPLGVIISPGPCAPEQAGASLAIIEALSARLPMLGVCLGHQCMGAAFGGEVGRALQPMHGRASGMAHNGEGVFAGLPQNFPAGRYHSLIVRETPLMLRSLRVDARSDDGEIMALSHRSRPMHGVQFHPESVLTGHGHALLGNFIALAEAWRRTQDWSAP